MLGNHHRILRQQPSRRAAQQPQRRRILLSRIVRRIEKHHIESRRIPGRALRRYRAHAARMQC